MVLKDSIEGYMRKTKQKKKALEDIFDHPSALPLPPNFTKFLEKS
jgi:hypothetical protein